MKTKHTNDIKLPTEKVIKIIEDSYYEKSMQEINKGDVTINYVEKIFTNKTYY